MRNGEVHGGMGLSLATAERWVERWERQQQRYAVDREERFTVIADVVEQAVTGRSDRPLVVDLGCGPGSLAARLARRLPDADIVGVDMDPLLLELARTHHADAARYVDAMIGEEGWTHALRLDRPLDAAVSTTALHYLGPDALHRTYRQLAALLRPGGVLVNGDHFPHDDTALAGLAGCVGHRHAERGTLWRTRTGTPGGRPSRTIPSWPTSTRNADADADGSNRPPEPTARRTCPWPRTNGCCGRRGSAMSGPSGNTATVTSSSRSADSGRPSLPGYQAQLKDSSGILTACVLFRDV